MRRISIILRIAFLTVISLLLMCSCSSTSLNQQKQDGLSASSILSVCSFKNSYSDSLSCLSYASVDTSKNLAATEEAEEYIGKLSILSEIDSGNAVITASKSDISNPIKCVDLDPSTVFISDGSEKVTQIKITFTTPIPVTMLRTLIGEPGYDHITNDWWLETADTEADLSSRKGSYEKLVPLKIDSCGKWEETVFPTPVLKKIWRFSIQKKVYDYCVSVPEIEFYGPTTETVVASPENLVVVKESATTITLGWEPSGGGSTAYSYEVYRNGEYIGNTCGTNYTDKALKKETSYTYEVRAVSQMGNRSSASPSITHSTSDHTHLRTDYNVIVLYYNPVIKAGTYKFYDSVLKKDVSVKIDRDESIADRYGEFPKMENYLSTFLDDFNRVSGGFADINIYETRKIDYYPPANNQAWLNDNIVVEFEELNKSGHLDPAKDYDVFHHGSIDYSELIREENLIPLVEAGDIDAVWVFCTYPYSGFFESVMAGRDSYYCNGPAINVPCSRRFIVYGFGGGAGGMFEEVGHSVEDIMNHVSEAWPKKWIFNVWNTNNYYLTAPDQLERHLVPFKYNDWQVFTLTDAQNYGGAVSRPEEVQEIQSNLFAASPKHSQVGSIHYPPSSLRGTDYAFYDSASLSNSIVSYADDWYNYPFFTGKSRRMNGFDWGAWINYAAADPLQRVCGDRRAYLCWWFDHIPKNKGLHNGILNNWWPYLMDLDQFDGSTIDYEVKFPDTAVKKERFQSLKTEYATEAGGISSWGYWCVEDNGFKVKFEKNNGTAVKGKTSLKVSIVSLSDPIKLIYPSSKKAGWNLSKFSTGKTTGARYINFYAKLEDIKPESFISANPVVSLCTDSGNKIVLSPSGSKNLFATIKPDRSGWYYFHIPITGNSSWKKTNIGKPDLSKINYIELEIRANTNAAWDSSSFEDGYSISLDGLSLQ